jgi:hypothetical protein
MPFGEGPSTEDKNMGERRPGRRWVFKVPITGGACLLQTVTQATDLQQPVPWATVDAESLGMPMWLLSLGLEGGL